ncbi:acyl-CoA dehydrogenase family protein [Blastococcus sp. Marseille-P5729]|uniref:acyl-CoA dehydrogenase family protein n=1 Tax=Blastococcus sp. Marseille-P5729 TaxID=2086582 RepID=UPI000D0E6702|nr:acyl-CoA dehydrogenase family protein [Blastococcus sp. Marseille-P5729]
MDFTYTGEQETLRETLRRYLDKAYAFDRRQGLLREGAPWSEAAWTQFAELGLLALPFGEADGGTDGTITDVVAVSELFGSHLTIEPYLSNVMLAGRTLAAAGDGWTGALLERMMSGQAQIAFAHEEKRGTPSVSHVSTTAMRDGAGYRLAGQKELVLAAEQAERLLVTARTSGAAGERTGLVVVAVDPDADGVSIRPYRTIDGRAAASVRFEQAPAEPLQIADVTTVLDDVLAQATIALAAESVGAMGALLRTTAEYATTRQQFGVPIASFQVIAHRLADMKMAYSKARATLLYTTALAEAGQATGTNVSVLKAQVGRCGRVVGEHAVQIHGGIGTTDELSVGHYLKRVLAIESMLGDTEFHLRLIGATAGI